MIKVYFGPCKYSPAPELPADERFLWLKDFHLLRGFDRDFWTNNPLILDSFETQQIMVWFGDQWRPMAHVIGEILPTMDGDGLGWMSNATKALMCERAKEAREAAAKASAGQSSD